VFVLVKKKSSLKKKTRKKAWQKEIKLAGLPTIQSKVNIQFITKCIYKIIYFYDTT